jgi:hypothetical protein
MRVLRNRNYLKSGELEKLNLSLSNTIDGDNGLHCSYLSSTRSVLCYIGKKVFVKEIFVGHKSK